MPLNATEIPQEIGFQADKWRARAAVACARFIGGSVERSSVQLGVPAPLRRWRRHIDRLTFRVPTATFSPNQDPASEIGRQAKARVNLL